LGRKKRPGRSCGSGSKTLDQGRQEVGEGMLESLHVVAVEKVNIVSKRIGVDPEGRMLRVSGEKGGGEVGDTGDRQTSFGRDVAAATDRAGRRTENRGIRLSGRSRRVWSGRGRWSGVERGKLAGEGKEHAELRFSSTTRAAEWMR
jgi:hypothetical protein